LAGLLRDITGTIVLEDALGFTFYDWYAASPKGEIYASTNDTIQWIGGSEVHCFNFTSETEINMSTEEARYGITDLQVDGFNETFQ